MKIITIVFLAAAAASIGGCRHKAAPEPSVATPSIMLGHDRATLGSPIEITYRFEVAPDAPAFTEDYRVFVHVVDTDQELMWTEDHDPPVPTTQWKRGQRIEYTRTVFVPQYPPFIGDASVHMGLYSLATQKRLPLAGQDAGQRAYIVAKLQQLPQTENVLTTPNEGWHGPESPPNNTRVDWQWTKKKQATLDFKNPMKDCVFYLDLDNSSNAFPEGQRVQVKLGAEVVDEFALLPDLPATARYPVESGHRLLRKIPLTATQLGSQNTVELTLEVDKTFVPALMPASTSKDTRELGIRVFHTFIEPKK
jgi:hypothetical protein